MVITMEDYQNIRRMFLVEKKSKRQIARELHISRNTVNKYCLGNIYPGIRNEYHRVPTVITDATKQFIQACLQEDSQEPNKKQHHTAKRIYDRLVEELGFSGGESTIRNYVHILRESLGEAFVPLEFSPGDAMQIDWGEAYVYLQQERIKVYIFCARLCYSCAPFAICFRKQNEESFLEGLKRTLEFFGGVPRRVIFDNASIAVKTGSGKNAVPQDDYKAFAAHYCFKTDFCNVRSGNEKGLVENLVGWTRRNILVPVPHVASLSELNQLVKEKCEAYAQNHQIQGRSESVEEMLKQDCAHLLPLPGRPYDTGRLAVCRVSSFATVRFASNSYSVPVEYTGQEATLRAYGETVRIFAKGKLIAEHIRNYGREQQILNLAHYLPILERKPRSIFQAKPVRQNLSPKMLELLQAQKFSSEELMSILKLCAEQGEEAFWHHRKEFRPVKEGEKKIPDVFPMQKVDLSHYDHLLEGGDNWCRTQV